VVQSPVLLLPESLQGVTPEWLTLVLRQSGALQSSCVRSVEILSETLGNGMAAQISRIGLLYDQEENGQPRTLVVKRPAADPNLRAYFQSEGAYMRESFFYSEIAGRIQTRSPYCYFAAYTPDPPYMLLLLEDLGDYEQVNWADGCSLERARLVLREMALLHAAWWMSPELNKLDILIRVENFDHSTLDQDFRNEWPAALEVLGLDSSKTYRAICKRLEGKIVPAFISLGTPPLTLTHLDFQLDNMVFGKKPGQAAFVLLDWAILASTNPAIDLAFFLCQNLEPSLRRAHERELIGEYLAVLAENGVVGYTLEACLTMYRSALLPILPRMIAAVYSQLPLTLEKAKMLRTILTRLFEAIIDHW
jgi:hypothetical protein